MATAGEGSTRPPLSFTTVTVIRLGWSASVVINESIHAEQVVRIPRTMNPATKKKHNSNNHTQRDKGRGSIAVHSHAIRQPVCCSINGETMLCNLLVVNLVRLVSF